jgi:hypothetical protein
MITLVVSRFNEASIPQIERVDRTLVINKGAADIDCEREWIVSNIGFEAQSWALYFATEYDNLSEWTICLQANPWDHVKPAQVAHWMERIKTEPLGYVPLSMHSRICEMHRPDHPGIPLEQWWNKCKLGYPPAFFWAWFGGQFIVRAQEVKRYPKAFWQRLAETIITKEDACCMERLWQFLFV